MSNLASAVCSSPISRTNFSANQILTSTRLNTELNTVYSRANELPGDCITAESITTTQIDDGTIVNADISTTAGIARTKLASATYQLSSSSGAANYTSTTYVDVTNLSVTITTIGGPVEIVLVPSGSTFLSSIESPDSGSANNNIKIVRGSTDVCTFNVDGITAPPSAFSCVDTPTSGDQAYKVQAKVNAASNIAVNHVKLFVREL